MRDRAPTGWWAQGAFAAILVATVGQLALAVALPDLEQFEGKAFTARLVAYPLMMLAVPAVWWVKNRGHDHRGVPWAAFAWIALPFLVDTSGNTADLYDSVGWWDDANHLVNWFFLGTGAGLLVTRSLPRPSWAPGLMVAGIGAGLAILWEIGEYYAFIRGGTELDTAYTDTLGDLTLGSLGSVIAGGVVAHRYRREGAGP